MGCDRYMHDDWCVWNVGYIHFVFFFQAEDGIRDDLVTGVQTCALPIFQLHNNIVGERGTGPVSVGAVIGEVIPALLALQSQGKTRFWGITALGDTGALHRVLDAASLHTAQVCYNLLNPSAGVEVPSGFPAQDFRRVLERARERRVGVIVIRVLAGGALSGVA